MIHHDIFGTSVLGQSLGEAWYELCRVLMKKGEVTFDEGRKRLSLQNVRIKSVSMSTEDEFIDRYANKKNIQEIVRLTFEKDHMHDIDVNPSFANGARSYHQRLVDSRAVEYVVQRLSRIPESKKAVIVFPDKADYEAVLQNPWNDYLPCIVAVHFRMIPNGGSGRYKLNVIFFARSIDAYQKSIGNLVAISTLAENVREGISSATGRGIVLGDIDGFVSDAHIYEENFLEVREMVGRGRRKND